MVGSEPYWYVASPPAGVNAMQITGGYGMYLLEVLDSEWGGIFTAQLENTSINGDYTIVTCDGCGGCGTVNVSNV